MYSSAIELGNEARGRNSRESARRLSLGELSLGLLLACLLLQTGSAHAQIVLPASDETGLLAGNGNQGYSGDGGLAINSEEYEPGGVAVDASGNVYIADTLNNVVREISASTGIITTIAGNGTAGYSGDGGAATSAELNTPWSVAVDSHGNVYIADTNNCIVRMVNASTGVITTVAGTPGSEGYSGDGGQATAALMYAPDALAFDSTGNLYITDANGEVVRKVIVSSGVISTFVGNGSTGYSGDGGAATSAELNSPFGIAFDSAGNLYIADTYNNVIRKVNTSGIITTVAGNSTSGYSGDGGSATSAEMNGPSDVAVDSAGNLFISDTYNDVIRLVTSAGVISTVAGDGSGGFFGDDRPATSAEFDNPTGIATDSAGNLYIADYSNSCIWAMGSIVSSGATWRYTLPPSGYINTFAGTGSYGYSGDSGLAINAEFAGPWGLASDSAGNFYIADTLNNVIRKVAAATGIITTVAGNGSSGYSGDGGAATSAEFDETEDVAMDSAGNLYIADLSNDVVRKVTTTGIISTVAGTNEWGYTGDGGAATAATLSNPASVTLDGAGNLFIADTQNNVIREVTASSGIITTLAGNGTQGYSGDGGAATSAELNQPWRIKFDAAGNLLIADSGNNAVRKVTPSGVISTVAGNGTEGYSGDGGPATSATLSWPTGVAGDSAGNIYISDGYNNVVRKVTPSGVISTIAGNGTAGYTGDGDPATSAELDVPGGLLIDSSGNLYIVDSSNDVVRVLGGTVALPVQVTVSPTAATLYASQPQQFTATVANTSNTAVTWSITPSGVGTVNSSGLYTAPATISTQQTVTVTATSQADNTKYASATVTLMPPAVVSVSPATSTLYANQTQQLTATVTNATNTAVTWSISPSNVGSITSSGLYIAPDSVTAQQTITVTATSQAETSRTGTATITLSPTQCGPSGYGYKRAIVIDHTQVPNTDQLNFPFLFSTTDPTLASTSNGGHISSNNGYDIYFSLDPSGVTSLNYELEKYNPATGQVIAFVRVPSVSHTTDTIIYLFYGNPSVTTPQGNATNVWNSSYQAVYHLANVASGSAADSTTNGNSGTVSGATAATGEIDGAASFNGSNAYVQLPELNVGNVLSASAWFQTTSNGVILGNSAGEPQSAGSFWNPILYVGSDSLLRGGLYNGNGTPVNMLASSVPVNDGGWHLASYVNNGTAQFLYLDGRLQASAPAGGNANSYYTIGTDSTNNWADGNGSWFYFDGSIDEVRLSNVAVSSDWIATEYNNQRSPSSFYELTAENTQAVVPNPAVLYASQSEQFSIAGACIPAAANWSMPAGSPGTLSSEGIYTAPSSIDTQQTVIVTATTLGASSGSLTATITLMPPITIALTPASSLLYASQSQQFTAAVSNTSNTSVIWSISPLGAGNISSTGLYTAPSSITTEQAVVVTAMSAADLTVSSSAAITLAPPSATIPVAVGVSPTVATLYASQTQQFTASVVNTSNTAVTWSISPSGVGTINSSGEYTAPSTISSAQTIAITATSQADTTKSATATMFLSPSQCVSNGYSYVRTVEINHAKVPNTDQTNFPFLFSTTDPLLATTAHGGHVANSNGYDVIFTSDAAGQNKLSFEVEDYNPATGTLIAWVRIPTMSHSSNTVIYLFYGNSSITTSQQSPTAVWDSNFGGVWHLGSNGSAISTADSTSNANNATVEGTASVTTGEIGYGAGLTGSPNYIDAGHNASVQPTHTGTMSIWAYYNNFGIWTTSMANGVSNSPAGGAIFWYSSGNQISFSIENGSAQDTMTAASPQVGQWSYLTGTWDGSTVSLYENGALVASTPQTLDAAPSHDLTFGVDGCLSCTGDYLNGSVEEARVSNIARSADWIAAEYNNQSSPSTFYTLYTEASSGVAPASVTLYASQSQQFDASGLCGASVSWSLSTGAPGSITTGGVYTAPATISEQQNVTITAAATGSSSESATVTLMPPISVTVTPASVTLAPNQNQQFAATVANTSNQSVTWTISPAGTGTIDASGNYTAPSSITTEQTVTITATSAQDGSTSGSATVTLNPSICVPNGYGFQRVIVINHTKVPDSDKTDFPFLFNTTDSDLASIDHGGHVASPNGYDIIFSSDPNGLTKLDHEIEQYNPATGQLVAWVRIPTLSHTIDTVVYVFYGNPNITSSQQNATGVWNSSYQAVYHVGTLTANAGTLTAGVADDSTVNGNNASWTSVSPTTGIIDGAAAFNGNSSFMQIPSADFSTFPNGVYANLGLPQSNTTSPFVASFGVWFKTSTAGGILTQVPSLICEYFLGDCYTQVPTEPGASDPGGWNAMLYVDDIGNLHFNGGSGITTTSTYNDNNWHFAVVTFASDGTDSLYVDGQNAGSINWVPTGYSSAYSYFVGTAYTNQYFAGNWDWLYFNGNLDEVSITNTALSSDWIRTEYNNQSSPSTFYTFYPRSAVQVVPPTAGLYASQNQQFAVASSCSAAVTWTLGSGAPGNISSSGLYKAPSSVTTQQNVSVSASVNGSSAGSATVTLLPQPAPITLAASSESPYTTGSSQSFTSTVLDQSGSPVVDATVNFTITGVNSGLGAATTNGNGVATYSYTGANSGSDSIAANASVDGVLLTSNAVAAVWVAPVPPTPAASVALSGPPSIGAIGLMGAFTNGSGSVIEPINIGASQQEFIVPTGATQLQLGVDSAYYAGDGGSGFVVSVNGTSVKVPPTAMPWVWTSGALNGSMQFGLYSPSIQSGILDGTSPVVAATGLSAGQVVTVAYQSGLASANLPVRPLVNANGDPNLITAANEWQGTYFPTFYTTASAYPVGQPIPFSALVTNSSGAPVSSMPVTLTVTGANPGTYTATTDSTGTATFLYKGTYAGADSLVAQTNPTSGPSLTSSLSNVTWVSSTASTSAGSLALSFIAVDENVQGYAAVLTDASGNPITNASIGFYVWGADKISQGTATDETGHADFSYYHVNQGTYNLVAVATVNGNVVYSNVITGTWAGPSNPSTNSCSSCSSFSASISALTTVTMPNSLALTGTVTDTVGITPSVQWSQVSGPGVVTFATPEQANTTATFSQIGTYVVQLYATDTGVNATAQFQVSVIPSPVAGTSQGWIANPLYGSTVSGIVPITLATGITLSSGTLSLMPTNNTNSVTVLNASVSGTGQIGTLDATSLANGAYWIQLEGTDSGGNAGYSLVLVNVAGNYKPGRVTTTVTDLVVPSTGVAINIQRTYDSLNAATSSDFGFGWSLGINVNLSVSPKGDVTLTVGGQRRTFYLTPQVSGCSALIGCLFPQYFVQYTPEPGMHGTLVDSSQACPLDIVIADGSQWECQDGSQFSPSQYTYTDPTGTQYVINSAAGLQSISDRNGNGLTITPNGITSTTGLNVPFVRDDQNRITQITDPMGNNYRYTYDENGNLATVEYPSMTTTFCTGLSTTNTSQYNYYPNSDHPDYPAHYYAGGTDANCNLLPTTTYYGASDTDAAGNSLAGKLESVSDALGETTTYAYDLSTNTTTVTYPPDANHNVGHATMVYDGMGDLLSSTDPLNLTTTNTYDANQNLLSTTDPLGDTTNYTYDSNGNKTSQTYPQPTTGGSVYTTSFTAYNQYSEPTSTTDELGKVRTFNYDASYNPQSVTDTLGTLMSTAFNSDGTLQAGAIGYAMGTSPGQASQFTYDAYGNLASKTDALGRTTSYTYNALGQKVTMTPPVPSGSSSAAATTSYQYDPFGNLTQTSAPLSRTTSSTYDANGNKLTDTDANSNVTHYAYDALNRLTTTTYPDSRHSTDVKTYDFRNNVVTEIDQDGNETQHQYDLSGRQISVTMAYGTDKAMTTTYAYDLAGRKISQTDAVGHTTSYTYDNAGDLTGVSGVAGSFTYAYDPTRNRTSMTDGNNKETQYAYDLRKRLTMTTYPDSTTTKNFYDGPGNLTSVIDQAGHEVQYTYDAANQLASVVQTNSPNTGADTTIYGYDANGNPITLEDANSNTTTQNFDMLSELTSKTLPDGTLTESRTYDNNGNLQTVTHFNGVVTTYTYDQLNRLLSRATPGETTVSYTYTPTGKYLTSVDASGTTNYTYDTMDRLSTKATPEGTLSYAYDAAGHVTSISSNHTNGVSISYTYDSLNRLSTAVDGRLSGSKTTTYTYDNANNVETVAYPNGVTSTYAYDTLNRVMGLSSSPASYTYDRWPAGNLKSVTESSGRTVNWYYDGIYRLNQETIASAPSHNSGTANYGLDPVGNRQSEALSGSLSDLAPGSFSFNADDELANESYDHNGNVLATGGKSFTYDSQNELVGMSSGTTSVAFIYDAFGNRVGKSVNGVVTRYLVDDLNPTGLPQVMEELNGSGLVTRTYTYGLQRISEEQVISGAWTPSFYGYDGGGNVRQLTSSGGTVTDSYEYDAFGNSWTVSGTTPNNYLYRGEQYDSDLGLYYLRARYYNPLTGRFMSRDPEDGKQIDPRTLHKYLYAGGDPVNFLDPRGRDSILEVGAIDRDFLLDTVPAVVAFVGDFVVLQAIPFTEDAAAAVAEYLADAAEVIESNGLLRWYTCWELGDIYATVIDDVMESDAPEGQKEFDSDQLSDALEKACGVLLFHEPAI